MTARIPDPPIMVLTRWAEHGGTWRTTQITETVVLVELCTCYGEPVESFRSDDPELLRYLARQPR
jgi:hypothetical protein